MALWINDGLHEAAQGIRSFLLVGQSNMAGRGDLTPENTITAPDCFMLRMGRWQPMSEPINVDRAVAEGAVPRSGANLAASFAAQLQKETGAKIGLIPCADGGTRISQWQPGEVLFDHAVFQAKLAIDQIKDFWYFIKKDVHTTFFWEVICRESRTTRPEVAHDYKT